MEKLNDDEPMFGETEVSSQFLSSTDVTHCIIRNLGLRRPRREYLRYLFVLFSKALALHSHPVLGRQEGDRMRPTSKISGGACEDVAVVASHVGPRKRRRKVGVGLSFKAKRDVLEQFIAEYREAQGVQKRMLLDDFTCLTGYHRTYAIWLFNHHTPEQQTTTRVRQRDYGAEVKEVLVQVWNAANRVCSKLLIPSLPMFLDALERHEHLHLIQACRSCLLSMSTTTANPLLRPHRQQECAISAPYKQGPCSRALSPSAYLSRCLDLWKKTW